MPIWAILLVVLLAAVAIAAASDLRDRKKGQRTRLRMPRGQIRRREARAMRNGLATSYERDGLREEPPRS
ncbi:hypothetical protein CFN78_10765 [Amycolatopsis antarctica]|uniref:Uncharacterized protein n=1 Tax=Amycolatopsis antarctica TaxID=1854586 RepID=A0A263D4B0_9PSEU|nr:hypothetical protein [Amycolatopsis antarctica]OZM73324.1 hypothetical protein CFN78_10765 [Amycolatopsis antarctica]